MGSGEFLERNYKIELSHSEKPKQGFFPKRLCLISSQFASSNRRDLGVYGNNMQKFEMLLKHMPKSATEQSRRSYWQY